MATTGVTTTVLGGVLTVTEARKATSEIARRFGKDGVFAEPVFFGSHRKPVAVMIPAALYVAFAEAFEDLVIAERIRERRALDDGTRISAIELDAVVGSRKADRALARKEIIAELGL